MKAIIHPNIIELVEIHESQNSLYLVMELLEGGEIFNLNQGKLDNESTFLIFKGVLKALVALDKHGIMHRDLKPDNIILKKKGVKMRDNILKLVDFGLATYQDVDEYLFKRCGTPGFVAPEVINAKRGENVKYNTKCDVFSVGIIFFFMLTGKIPYDGEDFQQVLENNKKAVIDFAIKELKNVTPVALDLLKRMLNLNPNFRPTAAECLKHEYFSSVGKASFILDDEEEEQEIDYESQMKQFKNKHKKFVPEGSVDSIHFKMNGTMKGITNTYGSFNKAENKGAPMSGHISSFDSVNKKAEQTKESPKAPANAGQRASIYKYALTKGGKGVDLQKEMEKMMKSSHISESVNGDSDSDSDGGSKSNPKPLAAIQKSRFAK
jgi:serine/threonine protein kinase